ncbi:MAG: 30S ribosome-binding factor RbfA [Chloroflexi bacterium]|nr:30S ribosome-binding factor RbfA [Chloroflexota bacterium]
MSRRTDRINELLREEISELLARQIKDPRLRGVISIIEVQTSGDLRNALVLLSVMGDPEAKSKALEGIQSAASFLRKELRNRLKLRYVPFLRFALDDTLEEADHLFRVMDSIRDALIDEVPVEERN